MKKLSFEKICSIIAFIFLIGSFFNLVPIKYNKSTKEYNGYYYSNKLKETQSKNPIKIKLIFKSYTKFDLFKFTKSNEFKGELFINDTKYDIKSLNFVNDKFMKNKYIGQIKNSKSNYNFSTIFISEDLNMAYISNYNKIYDISCTTKNLNDIKNLDMKFFKE
ncbi:hypothetical protein ACFLKB_05890 [Clostridium sp. FAM 1755]|uniref:hypothetical protein n=1 Tax=Clostridium caseinilyticum TaxID=3350403 RepID=UPI0038F6736A